jgi:hypothetical protein
MTLLYKFRTYEHNPTELKTNYSNIIFLIKNRLSMYMVYEIESYLETCDYKMINMTLESEYYDEDMQKLMRIEDNENPEKNIRPSKQINKIKHNSMDTRIKNIEDMLYNFTIDTRQIDTTYINMHQNHEYNKISYDICSNNKILKYDSDGPYYSDESDDYCYEQEDYYCYEQEDDYCPRQYQQTVMQNNNKQPKINLLKLSQQRPLKNNDKRCKKNSIKNNCRILSKY